MPAYNRIPVDNAAYVAELKAASAAGECFVCNIVGGAEGHRVVYRDDLCIAFFNRYPRVEGYVLLAPLEHRTGVVADFTEDEYVELQRRVHRVGRAISSVLPTERLYVFSFGSHQGVAHVHWHLAACPPGLPFEEQQFELVTGDYFDVPEADKAALAERIAAAVER